MEGGAWGLVVVASAFFIQVFVFGSSESIGVYNIEFLDYFTHDTVGVSLIASVNLAVFFCSGPLSSYLMVKLTYRKVCLIGSFLVVFGILLARLFLYIPALCVCLGFITGNNTRKLLVRNAIIRNPHVTLLRMSVTPTGRALGMELCNLLWNINTGMQTAFIADFARERGVARINAALLVTISGFGLVFGGLAGAVLGHQFEDRRVVVLADLIGTDALGDGMGYLMLSNGIGSFLGPYLAGHIRDETGNYDGAFYVGGAAAVASGNCVKEEIDILRPYQLTPTVSTSTFLKQWAQWSSPLQTGVIPPVVIKVDSGLSRNGCQPEEVPRLMTLCSELGVPVHSIMTHFAQAWDDENFTRQQLQTFLTAVQPYRQQGVKVQAANSEAVIRGIGNDLDFVRPGICLFGLPPAKDEESAKFVHDLGIRPVLSWIARPNLLKVLSPGRHIGYDQTYAVEKEETIATFSIGYGDGYNPQLADKGVLTSPTGQEYPVVGKVSMDAITVKVDQDTDLSTPFFVYKDDYTSHNSLNGIARMTGNHVVQESTPLSDLMPQ
nr:hypothetical protein BaRGS_033480 [Batillaria attramentaria]